MKTTQPKRTAGRPRADGKAHLAKFDVFKAAAQLVAQYGYAGASLRKIAAALDVNAPSILNIFPTKEHLLNELIIELSASTLNFHKNLESFNLRSDVALYKMIYEEVISVAGTNKDLVRLFYLPELRLPGFESALSQRTQMINNYQLHVKNCVNDNLFRDVNVELATEQIFQLTETSMIAINPQKFPTVTQQAAATAELILRGFLRKPSTVTSIAKKALACEISPQRGEPND